mgnify:CR=1
MRLANDRSMCKHCNSKFETCYARQHKVSRSNGHFAIHFAASAARYLGLHSCLAAVAGIMHPDFTVLTQITRGKIILKFVNTIELSKRHVDVAPNWIAYECTYNLPTGIRLTKSTANIPEKRKITTEKNT